MAYEDLEMNKRHKEGAITMGKMKAALEESNILLDRFHNFTTLTILQHVLAASFTVLLGVVAESNGDGDSLTNTMLKLSEPNLVLAVLASLATWFLSGVWELDLGTTRKESERELAVIEGGGSDDPQFSGRNSNAESRLRECVRDFYFRYTLLVFMRGTCIFLFLLGCIFGGIGTLRPPWFLLSFVLSLSLIFAIAVIVHVYREYVGYCNCLTRLGPTPKVSPKLCSGS